LGCIVRASGNIGETLFMQSWEDVVLEVLSAARKCEALRIELMTWGVVPRNQTKASTILLHNLASFLHHAACT
jgi:hypothetical protein